VLTPPESDRFLIVTADDFGLHQAVNEAVERAGQHGILTAASLHPAMLSGAVITPSMSTYRHADELAALVSPRVRALLQQSRTPSGGYGDCRNHRTASSIAC
jgi:predicted glycoside hydrolase/deacetylase ChbG (UPF0249 family)